MMKNLINICLAVLLVLGSCTSVNYPPCVSVNMHKLVISWGDHDMATGHMEGYKLDAYGNLYTLKRDSSAAGYKYDMVKTLPDTLYCTIHQKVVREIMKAQSLNAAIDIERFVEYRNPDERTVMRASWNPKYETKGNKGFVALYDYLNKIIKED